MIDIIIPARKGSKRVRDKNFKDFCGKPLIEWAIEKALALDGIRKIIVCTNNTNFTYNNLRVTIDYRPDKLAQDTTPMNDVVDYLRDKYKLNWSILLLEPPNPLCSLDNIRQGIELHLESGKNIIAANRYTYEPNGAFYIFNTPIIYTSPISLYLMEPDQNIEIDEPHHWAIVESLMMERLNNES